MHCNEIKECEHLHCNSWEGGSRVWLHAFTCQKLKYIIYLPDNDTNHIRLPLFENYSEKSVYVGQ